MQWNPEPPVCPQGCRAWLTAGRKERGVALFGPLGVDAGFGFSPACGGCVSVDL